MSRSIFLPAVRCCRCLLICGVLLPLSAQSASEAWRAPREALEQRVVANVFRIHFTRIGENAILDDVDVADRQVLRLGVQLERAYRFYSEVMGLRPPLASPRYQNVRAVDVHVIELLGKMGSTGDEPVIFRYRHFDNFVPALTISIARRWQPGNLTPEHEVFHAYQYGYTFFKNAWFLEGMARAMEDAFRDRRFGDTPLPQDTLALHRLLDQSYTAASFWRRLMRLCAPDCRWPASPGNVGRIDPEVCGTPFVGAFLAETGSADKEAAIARGIDPYNWPEGEQRSLQNNHWILRSLARSVEKLCPVGSNAELARFIEVLHAQQ